MSISLITTPPEFSPVYNELVYVIKDSANYTKPNFQYICEIFDGTGTNLLFTLKLYPDELGQAFFDIHRILENFESFDFYVVDEILPDFEPRSNSFTTYVTKFGEEYTSGGSEVSGITVTDSKRYAWNGIFDYEDFIWNYNDTFSYWLLASGQQNHFLTNSPRLLSCRPGCNFWLSCIQSANVVNHLCMKTYDFNGNFIATYRDYTNTVSFSTDAGKFLQVPAGHGQLYGAGRITSSVNFYTLTLEDSSNNPVSETFTIKMNYSSSKWIWYRLHFMNKLGGFDAFDFRQKSHQTRNITQQTYQRLGGLAGAYNDGITLQDTQRELTQFDTLVKQMLSVESDWISDAESTWLEELLTSTQVFIENPNGSNTTFTPVVIATSSYEVQQRNNGPTINIKLDLQYHYNKYRQRG